MSDLNDEMADEVRAQRKIVQSMLINVIFDLTMIKSAVIHQYLPNLAPIRKTLAVDIEREVKKLSEMIEFQGRL